MTHVCTCDTPGTCKMHETARERRKFRTAKRGRRSTDDLSQEMSDMRYHQGFNAGFAHGFKQGMSAKAGLDAHVETVKGEVSHAD